MLWPQNFSVNLPHTDRLMPFKAMGSVNYGRVCSKYIIYCICFFLFFKPWNSPRNIGHRTSSSSSSILGCCLYLLPIIFEVGYFHFLLQISVHAFCGLPIPLCPLGVHFNACLVMRSSLHINECPSQFHFLFSICTGSCPVSLHRSSLAILSGQCTFAICHRHL